MISYLPYLVYLLFFQSTSTGNDERLTLPNGSYGEWYENNTYSFANVYYVDQNNPAASDSNYRSESGSFWWIEKTRAGDKLN